ncbi:MAG: hypothetical protein IPF99_32820 [Deltaproteobacteria bacterium]|nr:hypothetical protein [Deltaproteobacteria bacterium]
MVFFNSGRWIEDLPRLRASFPRALFVYRTGGNEILKAPLERVVIADHLARQAHWAGNAQPRHRSPGHELGVHGAAASRDRRRVSPFALRGRA